MKQKDIALVILFAGIAAIVSFLLAGIVFKNPTSNTKVPVVPTITSDFPDVKNDPNYSAVFNSNALDPTQNVQIGNASNGTPFR